MATKAATSNSKNVFQNVSARLDCLAFIPSNPNLKILIPMAKWARNDVHISFEDQQKINCFAKHNARMDDLIVELEMKKNELKNIEEAIEEIELFDEDEDIPFLMGEVFLTCKLTKAQEHLATVKEQTQKEIAQIEAKANKIKAEMNELKSHLYQRFGSNISLESDD